LFKIINNELTIGKPTKTTKIVTLGTRNTYARA
jgi:hypothetical protein